MQRKNSARVLHRSIHSVDRRLGELLLLLISFAELAPIIFFGAANATTPGNYVFGCKSDAQCSGGAICGLPNGIGPDVGHFFERSCINKWADGIEISFTSEFDKTQGIFRQSDRSGLPIEDIHFTGTITRQNVEHLQQILASYPSRLPKTDIRPHFRFIIDSPGGDVYAAMELGRLLRANQASINNVNKCASACILTWVGAPIRNPWLDSPFIIHRPFGFSESEQDLAGSSMRWKTMQADIRRYLVEMNVPPTLLDAMNEVPSEEGRVLTAAELSRYLMDVDDPAYTEIYDAGEAQKRGISRIEYLARKRRVAECQERVESRDYPDMPARARAYGSCWTLYDKPT
jgi:ATP-dependent protease ClpP protease subunit